MGQHIRIGNPPIDVELKRSARARRLSLRVSRLDGRVTLTMPPRVAEREGIAFLSDREEWLRKHLGDMTEERILEFGAAIPLMGHDVVITPANVKRTMLDDDRLLVPNNPEKVRVRTKAFLKAKARDAVAHSCDRYSALIGKSYGRLTLRDTRSRWGSCTSKGDLMFSWRLIMAPPHILDYVCAHEVAHLVEMNHSSAFWALCKRLYPETDQARKWLTQNGGSLHRVRFSD